MAKIKITKKNGDPSPYFWSDDDGTDPKFKTVYKRTKTGVKRMTGIHFDSSTSRLRKP